MTRSLLIALLGLTIAAGCGEDDQPAAAGPPLEGTPWVLVSGLDVPGWEQAAPTANFADGKLSGFGGCNRYFASYSTDGAALDLGPVGATKMACGAPGNAVEPAFHALLERVAAWRTAGEELTLLDGEDRELLRMRPVSPLGEWEATAFVQGDAVASLLEGTRITAAFEDAGRLSGSAGCNRYTAPFSLDGAAITIEPPAATEMACPSPAGVMEQERAYLDALVRAASFSVDGTSLTLLTREGTIVATYTRAR